MMYLSPEMRSITREVALSRETNPSLKQQRYTTLQKKIPLDKVDIYAAGLVLFEMCGNFTTAAERCNSLNNIWKFRTFPKGFTDKFY